MNYKITSADSIGNCNFSPIQMADYVCAALPWREYTVEWNGHTFTTNVADAVAMGHGEYVAYVHQQLRAE